MVKDGLFYSKDHEWVLVEGDVATVGVSDHAQEHLGELTFVELPMLKAVDVRGVVGVLESSKAASDVYSPVAGEIIEANEALEDQPELVNSDCYGEGWLCKIKLADAANATADMMDAKAYEEYLATL